LAAQLSIVDSDPQCNLTSYLLSDDVVDELLNKSGTAHGRTIWSALKPKLEGTGETLIVEPQKIGNRLALLPGDIRLSEYEEFLGEAWTDMDRSNTFAAQKSQKWAVFFNTAALY
jgi:cellulose biosynthesis protein BcsQ